MLVGFLLLSKPGARTRAQNQAGQPKNCCGPTHPVAPRELDFAYYSLKNGFGSTLNLVSDSPAPLDFTLSVHSRSGLTVVAPKMTIQPQAKLPIDMAALLKRLGADTTGDFAEGSVSLNFVGTIMPLVGQITTTNPALRLVHESEMVENDPGRTDIPQVLNGLWWNIAGGRDAQVMVTNMSRLPASADVFLDFAGTRHPSAELHFRPHESKTVSIVQLLADLNATPSQVPEGGITIIQREFQPTLIAQGKVLDSATGFSTTLSFPDPARERANSLHASGVPIGKPTQDSPFARTGYFVPHVVLRNLTGAAQTASITVEFPKGSAWNSAEGPGGSAVPSVRVLGIQPAVAAVSDRRTQGSASGASNQNGGADTAATITPADLTGQFTLAPVTIAPYGTLDYSLDSIMGQLPLPLPYCSIRIQYSGAPGSALAQVSSVEAKSDMVIDSTVANEGDGWRGSGANPWHLDKETESILFLTDEGDKPARIGFTVTAGGVHYYLTTLELAPHETRAIDIRRLRDAQNPDFEKGVIPALAMDGSVSWVRVDNVEVSGRLVVIQRNRRLASSYDCCIVPCPSTLYDGPYINPSSATIPVGGTQSYSCTATYQDNNNVLWPNIQIRVSWSSDNTQVATVSGSTATGQKGGIANILAQTASLCTFYDKPGAHCICSASIPYSDSAPLAVDAATISSAKQITDGLTASFTVTPKGGTPTSYAGSFTSPQGAGNNPNVNFTPNNAASTTTDGHWFALPNDACTANLGAVYTITGTVTFPGNTQVAPQTTLTVNALQTAGGEPQPLVLGYPAIGQNSQGTWIVTGPGTLSRQVQSPLLYYASSSQFYNKLVAHENKHVAQFNTGMNADLYLVSSLMNLLSPLTNATQDGLKAQISNTWNPWLAGQDQTLQSRKPAAETEAYQVSDPIAPQYLYQYACGVKI